MPLEAQFLVNGDTHTHIYVPRTIILENCFYWHLKCMSFLESLQALIIHLHLKYMHCTCKNFECVYLKTFPVLSRDNGIVDYFKYSFS